MLAKSVLGGVDLAERDVQPARLPVGEIGQLRGTLLRGCQPKSQMLPLVSCCKVLVADAEVAASL